MRHGQKNIKFT